MVIALSIVKLLNELILPLTHEDLMVCVLLPNRTTLVVSKKLKLPSLSKLPEILSLALIIMVKLPPACIAISLAPPTIFTVITGSLVTFGITTFILVSGTIPQLQLPATFHRVSIAPVHVLVAQDTVTVNVATVEVSGTLHPLLTITLYCSLFIPVDAGLIFKLAVFISLYGVALGTLLQVLPPLVLYCHT